MHSKRVSLIGGIAHTRSILHRQSLKGGELVLAKIIFGARESKHQVEVVRITRASHKVHENTVKIRSQITNAGGDTWLGTWWG